MSLSRRSFLKHALLGWGATMMLPWMAAGAIHGPAFPSKLSGRLSLYNTHTEESLRIRYLDKEGNWIPEALSSLNRLFRCHYNHSIAFIDPKLFLLMDRIHTRLGAGNRPIKLISGYRSPEYNDLLISRGARVSKVSYHLKGMAADFHIKGISQKRLFEEARRLEGGGVGLYSKFVHVDVGPVRWW